MHDAISVRPLAAADLGAYKDLRDATLAAHPEAFTSDAATERSRSSESYRSRLGLGADRALEGRYTLGAWQGDDLVGAISCERDPRVNVRHIGHIVGTMVRHDRQGIGVGRALLDACLQRARETTGLEMLTLSVTAGNLTAIRLYERAGFVRWGSLPRAIRVGGAYHAKDQMLLTL